MTHLLVSPGFLVALAVLALNDHVLKAAYGNWLTGKLSDFAGLFAFALFLCAMSLKNRTVMCVGTAIAFVAWKLPVSDPVVAAWNGLGLWPVDRVLDPTDFAALVTVAFAWWYAGSATPIRVARVVRTISVACATFLFVATSRPRYQHELGLTLAVPHDPPTLVAAFNQLEAADWADTRNFLHADTNQVTIHRWDYVLDFSLVRQGRDSTMLRLNTVGTYTSGKADSTVRVANQWFADSVLPRIHHIADSLRRANRKGNR